MIRLSHRKGLLIVLGMLFLSYALYFTYTRDKVIVIGNLPFHVSRLDSFIENTNKGSIDKISIISIKDYKNIEIRNLSANKDKVISMSSGYSFDKCRDIRKTVYDRDITYTMISTQKMTMYILLHYKKLI